MEEKEEKQDTHTIPYRYSIGTSHSSLQRSLNMSGSPNEANERSEDKDVISMHSQLDLDDVLDSNITPSDRLDDFEQKFVVFSDTMRTMRSFISEQLSVIEKERRGVREMRERLEAYERHLYEREKKLNKDILAFQEKKKFVDDVNQELSDVVLLDVGGKQFTTSRNTLCSVEGSMLEAMFSGRHTLKQVNGRFVIDRDPKLFRYILAYLRDQKLQLPKDDEEAKAVMREFDYFCISPERSTADLVKKEWRNTFTLGGHEEIVMCLRMLSKDRLISGSKDKTVRIWDLNSGECIKIFRGHTSSVRHIKVIENKIVTASHDKTLRVWDIDSTEVLYTMEGHEEYVMCIKVLKESNTVLSGSHDTTIKTWDLATGKCIRTLKAHNSGVSCIKVVGNTLFSGSDDKTIKIWDHVTGECKRTLSGHEQYVMSIKSRGSLLFSGSWDKTIRIWNIATGECIKVLKGHAQGIYSIKVIDNVIISCSGDNTVKIWDANSGTCHKTLEGHRRHVMAVKVAGNRIFTGSSDKTIKVWEPF